MNKIDTRELIISIFSVALKVVLFVIAAMFIYKYALVGYDYGYRIFGEEPMATGEGRKVAVTVGADMGVKDIGQTLENKGLIRDANLFRIQERLSEYHGEIKPGIYELNTNMTAEEMIAIMASADEEDGDGKSGGSDSGSGSGGQTPGPLGSEEEYYIDTEDSDPGAATDGAYAPIEEGGETE